MMRDLTEVLNLRSEYESAVSRLKIPSERKVGTIRNVKWFIAKGHKSNRFTKNYPAAKEAAERMVEATRCITKRPHKVQELNDL